MNPKSEQRYLDLAENSLVAAIERMDGPLDPDIMTDIATSLRHVVAALAEGNYHAAHRVVQLARLESEVRELRKGSKR